MISSTSSSSHPLTSFTGAPVVEPEESPEPDNPRYGTPFWLAYASNALVCVALALLYRYADLVLLLGGTELHLGWIIGLGWIGSLGMRFFLGKGIDSYGTRRIWLGSLAIFVACCFAHLGLASCHGPAIYLLRIAQCTAMAGIFGASTTFIAGRAAGPRMAELIGMLGTSGFVGMMLGTQLGDLLCGAEPSSRGVFAMFAAAGLLGIAAIPFAWTASRREKAPARRNRLPMLWVVRRYHPGMLLAVGVVTGAALSVPSTFLRTYAAELGIPRIGLFFTVVGLTAVATRVASRRLPERFGLAPILLVGLAVMALAQLLFLTVRSEWQLIVPGLVHGVAQAILYPMVTAAGSSSFPSRYRGLGTTLILASLDIGQLIGAPAVGMVLHLSEAAGWARYPTMFLAMAAVLSSVAGTYAISLKRMETAHGGSNGRALRRRVNGVAAGLKPRRAAHLPASCR